MAKKFVRNITNSKLRGMSKEPLDTNVQNDLLSDEEDAFIRNKNEYHCLTDNIKSISITDNDYIKVKTTGKNTRRIDVNVLLDFFTWIEQEFLANKTSIENLETSIENLETRINSIEERFNDET